MNPTGLPGMLAQRWLQERKQRWDELSRGNMRVMDLPVP
jgi:hypothetical protein